MPDQTKTVGLVSLGCSKNRVDSEMLLGQLRSHGYQIVQDPADAEMIFVNTCGFIESAKEESIEAIFDMARYKTSGRLKKLFVTGCLAQRYGDELKAEIPEIDALMGVSEYARLMEVIGQAESGKRPMACGDGQRFLDGPRVLTTPSYSAYIKISDGCDNRCSYCAIPLIRGGYRSRPMDSIINECRELALSGVSELTLIAQDTSRYGNDFPGGELLLPELLRRVHDIDGAHWLRVLYCYPDTVNERLLDAIAGLPKVAKYMDLPLQHISRDMLSAMNRRGTPELIRSLIEACKEREISVRTTMIVGFPGETDAHFGELCDFVRWARFRRLGAFTYSPEEGTVGAGMSGQVDEDVKRHRLDQLMLLQQGISLELNEQRLGEECELLVEREEDGAYIARSIQEAPEVDGVVRLSSHRQIEPGSYVRARITGADAYDLAAEEMEMP